MRDLTSTPVDGTFLSEIERDWDKDPEFHCKLCHGVVYKEPANQRRWGCVTCKFFTHNPSIYFDMKVAA
jgi:protein-arginine kinase activator protein McsA